MENSNSIIPDEVILPPTDNIAVNAAKKIKLRGRRRRQRKRPMFNYPDLLQTKERIRECQLRDVSISPYVRYLETGELPMKDSEAREVLLSIESYLIEDGVLFHLL